MRWAQCDANARDRPMTGCPSLAFQGEKDRARPRGIALAPGEPKTQPLRFYESRLSRGKQLFCEIPASQGAANRRCLIRPWLGYSTSFSRTLRLWDEAAMSLLAVVAFSALILLAAYVIYGRVLGRLLRLDPNRLTPAWELRDDLDYSPLEPNALLSQHFSAIAAAGPIVGPILAGVMFGWVPALCWILVGSIFIGGVHDYFTLVASIRHKARSIAEVVRDHMSRRSYLLFLSFVWLALVYIIVAFTDITASAFVYDTKLENGQ